MHFRALEKSVSPGNVFLKKGTHPVFTFLQIKLIFISKVFQFDISTNGLLEVCSIAMNQRSQTAQWH